jgi:pimeloyl-ACP methyl ester carboxylesterase
LGGKARNTAPPVLLFRPLGGTIALWGPFQERLAQDFRVLAFDYRGVGDSSPSPLRVTTRLFAEDALSLLDRLKIERAHVFGISLGAMVASWFAHLAPLRTSRLCLASVASRGRTFVGRDLSPKIRLASCFLRRAREVEPCLVAHLLSPQFKRANPGVVQSILDVVRSQPNAPGTLLKNLVAALEHDASDFFPAIKAPTLVLAGGDDHLLPPEAIRKVAELIPGAEFGLFRDVGHDITLEAPVACAERVATFFQHP